MSGPVLGRATIGVIGSGLDEHEELARPVGALLAELGLNLLTGGGGGVMTSVSRAFTEAPRRSGICIGVIPCRSEEDRVTPKAGYPNPFVELPIFTHLPHSGPLGTNDLSRNHINVLTCAAVIALPGGDGTRSEIELAVRYRRPVAFYGSDGAPQENDHGDVPRLTAIEDLRGFIEQSIVT